MNEVNYRGNLCNNRAAEKMKTDSSSHKEPYYQEISVDIIQVPNYQRSPSNKRVRAMAAAFDPNRMQPIDVSLRGGKYYCYDGQHRLLMYRAMHFPTIPCIVHEGLTYQEEARLFVHQDVNVSVVRVRDKWNAMDEGEMQEAKDIKALVKKYGYRIDPNGNADGRTIMCIASLLKAHEKLDDWGMDRMFSIMSECFKGQPAGTCKEMVDGLVEFLSHFDGDRSVPSQVDWKRLYTVLRGAGAENIVKQAEAYRVGVMRKTANAGKRVTRVILTLYNGRRVTNCLPIVDYLV